MKIAIAVCERINGRCSSMGCFRAYNNKDKHFERYQDIETELLAFFSCDICSTDSKENVTKIAGKLSESGVQVVHLGACAVKCKADKLEEIKEVFTSIGINIVEGTH